MEREQLIKHWEVIQAFKEGKEIEFLNIKGIWKVLESPLFLIENEFRIKEESKYVPFDFSDAEKLIGRSIKSKTSNNIVLITAVNKENIVRGCKYITYDVLLNDYTFLDGSKCGKIKNLKK